MCVVFCGALWSSILTHLQTLFSAELVGHFVILFFVAIAVAVVWIWFACFSKTMLYVLVGHVHGGSGKK